MPNHLSAGFCWSCSLGNKRNMCVVNFGPSPLRHNPTTYEAPESYDCCWSLLEASEIPNLPSERISAEDSSFETAVSRRCWAERPRVLTTTPDPHTATFRSLDLRDCWKVRALSIRKLNLLSERTFVWNSNFGTGLKIWCLFDMPALQQSSWQCTAATSV